MSKGTIDQDGLGLHAIVWFASGEVVGNRVTVTVRDFDGLYNWFVRVETAMGGCLAQTGLGDSFDEACDAAARVVFKELEVEPDGAPAEDAGPREVRCDRCDALVMTIMESSKPGNICSTCMDEDEG